MAIVNPVIFELSTIDANVLLALKARNEAVPAAATATEQADIAGGHATNADASATAAGVSETNAGISEAKAEQWAEEDEDVEVEPGQFSSKHHAAKSEANAAEVAAAIAVVAEPETIIIANQAIADNEYVNLAYINELIRKLKYLEDIDDIEFLTDLRSADRLVILSELNNKFENAVPDGTYTNITSITVQDGIITAIVGDS
jgi:hypothetical protein